MSTHNIPFSVSQICSCWIFSKEFKNEFKPAMVNKPSVFEGLQVYCNWENSQMKMFLIFCKGCLELHVVILFYII